MTPDEAALKEYAEAGVELPGTSPKEPEVETPKEPTVEKAAETEKPTETLPETPKEERKRSIYDDYKDKKSEAKLATERAEAAERERDEWKLKFEALGTAKTPEEKQDAKDEIAEFASKINADPDTVREMQTLFLKGVKQPEGLTDDDRALLEKARKIEAEQAFNDEFKQTTPTLNSFFPGASQEEMDAIKQELYKLAHSEGWHDKSLDYIAFKHKDTFSALVSPKKRGIEGKSPKDTHAVTTDFDPNADISKMSNDEAAKWYEEYSKAGKVDGLTTDAQGRRIYI